MAFGGGIHHLLSGYYGWGPPPTFFLVVLAGIPSLAFMMLAITLLGRRFDSKAQGDDDGHVVAAELIEEQGSNDQGGDG